MGKLDRFDVQTYVERAFGAQSKSDLVKTLKETDEHVIGDILWDYMLKADDGIISKRELDTLRDKIKDLNNKSGFYGRFLKLFPHRRALVQIGPVKEEVLISPDVDTDKLKLGIEVLIIGNNEGRMLSRIRGRGTIKGRIVQVQRILEDSRVVVEEGGHSLILNLANNVECKIGDEILYDFDSHLVLEIIEEKDGSEYQLSDVPDVTFNNVKGLEKEKEFLKERIIYPTIYPKKFQKYGIKTIKGMLLYGPPGNGKTFLASAIFNEMSQLRQKIGGTMKAKTSSSGFFLINGPETLSKWVGSTEEAIRGVFKRARQAAKENDFPSVICWDELDAVAGKRKNVDTYTPEKTVIPTLLTELQGINSENDVIFIGISNRPDVLDPALLRPGRLGDAIIEIPQINKDGALEILKHSFDKEIPMSLKELMENDLCESIINHIYNSEDAIAKATLKDNTIQPIFRKESASGALFSQIGEDLIRQACIAEINKDSSISKEDILQEIDQIILSQLGIMDAGVKLGFEIDTRNFVIDVTSCS